jgi:Protein of unknown function (DUF4231)
VNTAPPKEKQDDKADIDALENEINGLENTKMRNYAINRVLKPVKLYRKSWKKSRHYEQVLQYIIIIAGALVSIANITSAILGGAIVISTGILQFQKYHEEWIMYKDTKAKLMYEFYCYKYCINDYATKRTTGEESKKRNPGVSDIETTSSNSSSDMNDECDGYDDIDRKFVRRIETTLLSEATSFIGLFNSTPRPNSHESSNVD